MSVNKVILIGRVGSQPEIRHLDSGVDVAKFSMATSEKYKNRNGESVEQTEWHNIVIWGKLSSVVEQYVNKGMLVYVEGKIKTRNYEDKSGVKHYLTEIYADSLQMLGSKGGQQQDTGRQAQQDNRPASGTYTGTTDQQDDPGDDLPF